MISISEDGRTATETQEQAIKATYRVDELWHVVDYETMVIQERIAEIARDTIRYIEEPKQKNINSQTRIDFAMNKLNEIKAAGGDITKKTADELV